MNDQSRHIQDLEHIGFTEIEAKVYLALLNEYPTTGYQISKDAGIPRSMVYESLGRLHARGIILRTENQKTTYYQPVPPQVLLNRYEEEHDQVMDRLAVALDDLYLAKDVGRSWSISGRSAVIAFAIQMIQEAKTEILMVLPDAAIGLLFEQIELACKNGITVSSLLTGEGELIGCGRTARHPPLESVLQGLNTMLVIVTDQKKCLIASTELDMNATITTNPHLVLISRQFIWMELFAQRIHSRLGERLLSELEPEDRRILMGYSISEEK